MKKSCKFTCKGNSFLLLVVSLIILAALVSVAVFYITKTNGEDLEDAEEYTVEEIDGDIYVSPGPGMQTPDSPPNIPPPTSPPPGS